MRMGLKCIMNNDTLQVPPQLGISNCSLRPRGRVNIFVCHKIADVMALQVCFPVEEKSVMWTVGILLCSELQSLMSQKGARKITALLRSFILVQLQFSDKKGLQWPREIPLPPLLFLLPHNNNTLKKCPITKMLPNHQSWGQDLSSCDLVLVNYSGVSSMWKCAGYHCSCPSETRELMMISVW